jgi:hypothetical protein
VSAKTADYRSSLPAVARPDDKAGRPRQRRSGGRPAR